MNEINGQWLGRYNGTNVGHITLNIEYVENEYKGVIVLVDDSFNQYPWLMASIKLEQKNEGNIVGILTDFLPLNPQTSLPVEWNLIRNLYPNTTIPQQGSLSGKLTESGIFNGTWNTNLQTHGNFDIKVSEARRPSSYSCEKMGSFEESVGGIS